MDHREKKKKGLSEHILDYVAWGVLITGAALVIAWIIVIGWALYNERYIVGGALFIFGVIIGFFGKSIYRALSE